MLVHDGEKRGEVQNGSLGIIFVILSEFSNLLPAILGVALHNLVLTVHLNFLDLPVQPRFFIYITRRVLCRVCYMTLEAGKQCSREFR